jgi:hypothetical protein
VLIVFAEDEQSAFAEASSKNHVVAKVIASTEVPEGVSLDDPHKDRPSPSSLARSWIDKQFSAPVAMMALGRILLVFGVLAIAYSFIMDTSVTGSGSFDRVHNIGLLNNRLVLVNLGSSSFLSGILLQCTAQILKTLTK